MLLLLEGCGCKCSTGRKALKVNRRLSWAWIFHVGMDSLPNQIQSDIRWHRHSGGVANGTHTPTWCCSLCRHAKPTHHTHLQQMCDLFLRTLRAVSVFSMGCRRATSQADRDSHTDVTSRQEAWHESSAGAHTAPNPTLEAIPPGVF